MQSNTRPFLIATAFLLAPAQSLHASPCDALAKFFVDVVQASEAEVKSSQLKEQVAKIRAQDKACSVAASEMAETGVYSHAIAGAVLPLNEYLIDDARFDVRVVGEGDKVEAVKFDADAIAVLRRRPTR